MPTLKPRISVTVSQDVFASINRLATATNQSISSVVCEVLEGVAPTFDEVARVVEAAAIAQRTMGTRIFNEFDQAEKAMTKHLVDAQRAISGTHDQLLLSLEGSGSSGVRAGGTRSAPPARLVAEPTPLSNRGVTNPKNDRTITKVTRSGSARTGSKPVFKKVGG